MTTAIRTYCDLCQERGVPVRHGLVAWREWQAIGHRYEDIDRCIDVEACLVHCAHFTINERKDGWLGDVFAMAGYALFILGTVPALMGALGIGR